MAAPGPSRWNSTALPAASGTSSDPETATSVRSVIAAAATPRRRRPPGESGSPLPRTGSGARPQSTSSLGECISGPTMLHVFPSPRRLLIEQALHGTIAPARSQQVPGARRDRVRSLHAVGIRPVVVGAAVSALAASIGNTALRTAARGPAGRSTRARARAATADRSPGSVPAAISAPARHPCSPASSDPRRRRAGTPPPSPGCSPPSAAGGSSRSSGRRDPGRPPPPGCPPDRQREPVNNPNSQLLTLGGNGDAAYSQCLIISISGLEVV